MSSIFIVRFFVIEFYQCMANVGIDVSGCGDVRMPEPFFDITNLVLRPSFWLFHIVHKVQNEQMLWHLRRCDKKQKRKTGQSIKLDTSPFLEKEEDIDIKIRPVSNRKFLFQSQNFCFKLCFFVSKCFFDVKIGENDRFCRSPGSNDKCRLHQKWCRRHFCFLLAAIIGGENIYRNVRPEPERIHEN